MIGVCAYCRGPVHNEARIARTRIGWVHSECATGDGPVATEFVTNHLHHYVSARNDDGKRIALLGPFPDHDTARENVRRGVKLANDSGDHRAPWYYYGTASSNAVLKTAFPLAAPEGPAVAEAYTHGRRGNR